MQHLRFYCLCTTLAIWMEWMFCEPSNRRASPNVVYVFESKQIAYMSKRKEKSITICDYYLFIAQQLTVVSSRIIYSLYLIWVETIHHLYWRWGVLRFVSFSQCTHARTHSLKSLENFYKFFIYFAIYICVNRLRILFSFFLSFIRSSICMCLALCVRGVLMLRPMAKIYCIQFNTAKVNFFALNPSQKKEII